MLKINDITATPYRYRVDGTQYGIFALQGFTSDGGKTFRWTIKVDHMDPIENVPVFPAQQFYSPESALQALVAWESSVTINNRVP